MAYWSFTKIVQIMHLGSKEVPMGFSTVLYKVIFGTLKNTFYLKTNSFAMLYVTSSSGPLQRVFRGLSVLYRVI